MLTVIGSINYDLVTTAKRIPDGGETVHATGFATHYGGKGSNEALALKRLSPPEQVVAMVGLVGNDTFGDELLSALKSEGVDVSKVGRSKERTGIATILVDQDGENRILVYPGANGDMTKDKVTPHLWEGSDYVLLQNEIPLETNLEIMKLATKDGVKTVYNPSPILDFPKESFQDVSILVVNSIEAATIAQVPPFKSTDDAFAALDILSNLGVRDAVVITLGAEGAVYTNKSKDHRGFVPSAKVEKVVDTTGAGDTFLAGFVSRLALGESLKQGLEFASKASAIVVTREGAASSVPRLAEIL